MIVAVTGADGFLGWHVRCALRRADITCRPVDRATFEDPVALRDTLDGAGAIVHAAGVNRADDEATVARGNVMLATRLVEAVRTIDASPTIVYANSTQSEAGGTYGESKAEAAEIIGAEVNASGGAFVDLVLPHLFGEFGRPFYNSAVITFAHQIAIGEEPSLTGDAELELLHAQDVAAAMLSAIDSRSSGRTLVRGRRIPVAAALELLTRSAGRYVQDSTIPAFADRFELQMFNMLRASLYRAGFYPRRLAQHADQRGAFVELCRADGVGQTSYSTSKPGVTRGEHYHVDKIERFVVVEGTGRVQVRRLLTDEVATYDVSGDTPEIIDMPPLCTHNITNTGDGLLGTFFWAGDHFDAANPDTYPEPVAAAEPVREVAHP